MYYFSMFLVVVSSIFYHVAQKSINEHVNPGLSMSVTYAVALMLSLGSIIFFKDKDMASSFKEINWAAYLLGVSIFVLEIGYLLVYRSGWSINITALFSNVITTLILIMVGVYLYKEQMSMTNVIGVVLSVVGLILMKK